MVLWMMERAVLTSGNHSGRAEMIYLVTITMNITISFSDVQQQENDQAQYEHSLQGNFLTTDLYYMNKHFSHLVHM